MTELLTDPHITALRALHNEVARYMPVIGTLPLAATANPELSPDGEAVAVGGSTLGDLA